MRAAPVAAVVVCVALAGCHLLDKLPGRRPVVLVPPTFSQYHLESWSWDEAGRVVVLPLLNESPHTRAGDEVRSALTAELQQAGRFEVVAGAPDDRAVLAAVAHRGGRFDEVCALELAKDLRADVVIYGTVTQYSPYPRPRLGLVLQAVSPARAKVVASVDGLWDSTDGAVAERCRAYYRQAPRPKPVWIRNHTIADDDSFAGELALDSPALFQRFVCREAVLALLGQPIPGVASGFGGAVVGPCPP